MSDPYTFQSEIEGGVFRRADPRAKKPARILIGPAGLRAEVADGTAVEIPWDGIRLVQEVEDGALQCISADRSVVVFSSDPEFLRAVEAAGGNDVADALSRMKGEMVTGRWKHTLSCLLVLAIVVALVWVVPRLFRSTIDGVVGALPYKVDKAIGEAVFDGMDLGGEELDDPRVRAAIQAIFDRLAPQSSLAGATFEFKIVESEVVNAFALPGGYITVFTGLIAEAGSPEEVAGVLAHEMAHVTQRHGLRRIAHSLGIWAAVSLFFGSTDVLTSIAVELFTLANVNDYSQDQETDADLEGARMMIAARIDPRSLAAFFAKLETLHGDVPDSLAWFSTHPQHRVRVAAIEAYTVEHEGDVQYEPLAVDWDGIRLLLAD